MITHSVFFNLHHAPGSAEEQDFFAKSLRILTPIPGVLDFTVHRQTSPKAPWQFGFSMKFTSQNAYDSYNNHPDHLDYVNSIWLKEVSSFQEIDHIIHPEYGTQGS